MSPTKIEESAVTKFHPVIQRIEELKEAYGTLAIEGVTDAEGIDAVNKAHRLVVSHRTAIGKKKDELKKPVLAEGRALDAVAKNLVERLAPLEAHLKHEKDTVQRELQKIAKDKLDTRMALLIRVNSREHRLAVEPLSDDAFEVLIHKETEAHETRVKEAAAAKLEKDKLAEERRQFDIDKAQLEQRQAAERAKQPAPEPAPRDRPHIMVTTPPRVFDMQTGQERLPEPSDPFDVPMPHTPGPATDHDWRALLVALVNDFERAGLADWGTVTRARAALAEQDWSHSPASAS